MRRLLGPLAVCLALVRTTFAAGEIEGPDAVPLHSLATVSTSVQADGYLWLVFPLETSFPATQADPKTLQFAGEPGSHLVILIPLDGGKMTRQFRKTVVFGGTPNPGPVPPGPTPNPTPNPTPPPGDPVTHVTLVLDVDANDPAMAAIRTSPAVRAAAEASRVVWRSYDDDAAVVVAKNLAPFLKATGGPPVLIAQAKDGRVVEAVKCPPTEAGVVEFLKRFRGN